MLANPNDEGVWLLLAYTDDGDVPLLLRFEPKKTTTWFNASGGLRVSKRRDPQVVGPDGRPVTSTIALPASARGGIFICDQHDFYNCLAVDLVDGVGDVPGDRACRAGCRTCGRASPAGTGNLG